MTRAAALARRTAGTLDPNCVVVITDGPVIGTPGNTSPTEIELQPVTSTDLGRAALVHTTFDNTAFIGNYNIDAGTAGSLNALTDHWGNSITDEDDNAPTVQTQFPYHLSGPAMRDNSISDCVLPGWSALTSATVVSDNTLQECTVNLTGNTSGSFQRNRIQSGLVNALTAMSFINDNQLTNAVVDHQGTGAGSFSFQNNSMLTGFVAVDATTTTQVTVNNNSFGGAAGGYRLQVTGKTGFGFGLTGCRLFNTGLGAEEMFSSGPATQQVTNSQFTGGSFRMTGTGDVFMDLGICAGMVFTNGPGGTLIQRTTLTGAVIDHDGSGQLTLTASNLNGTTVATSAASTRGLTIDRTLLNTSTVTQSGTGSATVDMVSDGSTVNQSALSFNTTSAGSPGAAILSASFNSGSVVTVANNTATTVVDDSTVDSASALNLSGGGTFTSSRLSVGAVLNGSGVTNTSVIDGPISKTTGATNTGALADASFDNWI